MTWSIGLTNTGDLALGGNQLAKVSNEQKLIQDLKCELLEKRGYNKFYQNYGSNLENQIIGNVFNSPSDIELQIETEIADVIRRHQARQLSRAKADKMSFGKATLTAREVVMDFQIIKFEQSEDSVDIIIELTTAKGNPEVYPIALTLPL